MILVNTNFKRFKLDSFQRNSGKHKGNYNFWRTSFFESDKKGESDGNADVKQKALEGKVISFCGSSKVVLMRRRRRDGDIRSVWI